MSEPRLCHCCMGEGFFWDCGQKRACSHCHGTGVEPDEDEDEDGDE